MRKLSSVEKLQVALTINETLPSDKKILDPSVVFELIRDSDEWALPWEYDFFEIEAHPKDVVVTEVVDILTMYRHLQASETEALGQIRESECEGFDANNGEHFHVANVLVGTLKRFDEVRGATKNSHSIGSIEQHRSRLSRYRAVLDRISGASTHRLLEASEIEEVLG